MNRLLLLADLPSIVWNNFIVLLWFEPLLLSVIADAANFDFLGNNKRILIDKMLNDLFFEVALWLVFQRLDLLLFLF
jgi:hypothetical protein